MKGFYITLIFFILKITFLYAQLPQEVKGGFKECTVYKCFLKDSIIDTTNFYKAELNKYNVNGNLIYSEGYMPNSYKDSVKYDSNRLRIEEVIFKSDGSIDKTKHKYNSAGKPVEILHLFGDSLHGIRSLNKFDDKGNLIETLSYDVNGFIRGKHTRKYDNVGNLIEEIGYNPNKSIAWKNNFKYDSSGHKVESINNSINGNMSWKQVYKNDEKGNNIEVVQYRNNKVDWKDSYKYDDNGHMIERVECDSTGFQISSYFCKYDKWGNIIEKLSYNNLKLDSITKYVYF
jgi:hypothetical protein